MGRTSGICWVRLRVEKIRLRNEFGFTKCFGVVGCRGSQGTECGQVQLETYPSERKRHTKSKGVSCSEFQIIFVSDLVSFPEHVDMFPSMFLHVP